MMIAIPIKPAMSAAPAEKACFGIAFWIKLGNLKTAASAIRKKRNIMILAHRMINRYIIFIFDVLTLCKMCRIRCFSIQWRQRNTTAGNHRRPHGLKDITANRTNVNLRFQHIGRPVCINDLLASEQFGHRYLQRLRQWLKQRNIWIATASFP